MAHDPRSDGRGILLAAATAGGPVSWRWQATCCSLCRVLCDRTSAEEGSEGLIDAQSDGAEHRFEAHTGEVRLEVSAPSREALFAEAGRALGELLLGERAASLECAPEHRVEVRARDTPALLVDWLNELIFLSEIHKQVFTRFRVEHVDDRHVRAIVSGVSPEALSTVVKAATFHDVALELRGGRWRATVVLDV